MKIAELSTAAGSCLEPGQTAQTAGRWRSRCSSGRPKKRWTVTCPYPCSIALAADREKAIARTEPRTILTATAFLATLGTVSVGGPNTLVAQGRSSRFFKDGMRGRRWGCSQRGAGRCGWCDRDGCATASAGHSQLMGIKLANIPPGYYLCRGITYSKVKPVLWTPSPRRRKVLRCMTFDAIRKPPRGSNGRGRIGG